MRSVVNERLLTSHVEEKNRAEHLKEVEKRRINTEAVIKKLEAELQQAQQQKNYEVKFLTYNFNRGLFFFFFVILRVFLNCP